MKNGRNRKRAAGAFVSGVMAGLTVMGSFVAGALAQPVTGRFQNIRNPSGPASDMKNVGRDMYAGFRQVKARDQAS
ncbi:MAG: hypothetical protein CMO30_08345 [Tistrella sp.]|uniref:Uncharacterized protein n=1 Tax=Tistrella mobilis TaxID=171437 RepID=A0A3B9IFB8_9PROT|nr:hypothetical protein [Tistrella sp.]MAD36158.1 hypothetical protein [Tistrella sp.]MBA75278.1 hypothetical protein [Tistrella sp.]HAE46063.1 hypothetical protein [Tistrella mobilis]